VNALVGVVVGLLFGLDLIERLLGVLAQRGQIGQHLPARLRAIGCAERNWNNDTDNALVQPTSTIVVRDEAMEGKGAHSMRFP